MIDILVLSFYIVLVPQVDYHVHCFRTVNSNKYADLTWKAMVLKIIRITLSGHFAL